MKLNRCLVLFLGLYVVSCTHRDESDYHLLIGFTSTSAVTFSSASRVKIQLWAHSKLVADAPATNLQTTLFPINNLNQSFDIRFDKADFDRVEFKSGEPNEFGYYITFAIDVNGDSSICAGDYMQDFDAHQQTHFDMLEDGRKNLTLSIKPVTDTTCFDF